MITKPILILGSIAITIAAALLAWRAHHHLKVTAITLAAANNAGSRAKAEIQRAQEQLTAARQRHAELLNAPVQVEPPSLISAPQQNSGQRGGRGRISAMDYPTTRAAGIAKFRAQLTLRYVALYRQLKLSPAQIARFENILIDEDDRQRALLAEIESRNLPPTDPARAELLSENTNRTQTAMSELLGGKGAAQYADFNNEVGRRNVVRSLVGSLALSANALSPSQAQQLTTALRGFDYQFADMPEAFFTQVGNFLTPYQVDELRAQLNQNAPIAATKALAEMIAADKAQSN